MQVSIKLKRATAIRPEREDVIEPPKGKRVGESIFYLARPSMVWHDIQIAFRVRRSKANGRRNHTLFERQNGADRFQRASSAQRMSVQRFRGAHGVLPQSIVGG
jgi:hypothetical protein